jgi:putative NADPH-quinone reductase
MFINCDETYRDHPGHPDPSGDHYGNALATAYAEGASECGKEVKVIDVAKLDFPLLRTKEDFERGVPPESIRPAQETISRADRLLTIYPLWLGAMPALLKGFFEQVFRLHFLLGETEIGKNWKGLWNPANTLS